MTSKALVNQVTFNETVAFSCDGTEKRVEDCEEIVLDNTISHVGMGVECRGQNKNGELAFY